MYQLTLHVTADCTASRALRHVQIFLGVDKYVDAIHPPPMDDQRYIELMAYRSGPRPLIADSQFMDIF